MKYEDIEILDDLLTNSITELELSAKAFSGEINPLLEDMGDIRESDYTYNLSLPIIEKAIKICVMARDYQRSFEAEHSRANMWESVVEEMSEMIKD